MKTKILLMILAILATSSIVLADRPAQIRGKSASAVFEVEDPNGCTVTLADVFVWHNEAYREGDPIENASYIDITYYEFGQPTGDPPSDPENCDGLYYFEVRDTNILLDDRAFEAHGGLHWATLDTVITVYDIEEAREVDLGIVVEWTATGTPSNQSRPASATFEISSTSVHQTPFVFTTLNAEISRVR